MDDAEIGNTESAADVAEQVVVELANVPASITSRAAEAPLVAFSMLPHENKMSVLHFRLTMHPSYDLPIKYVRG